MKIQRPEAQNASREVNRDEMAKLLDTAKLVGSEAVPIVEKVAGRSGTFYTAQIPDLEVRPIQDGTPINNGTPLIGYGDTANQAVGDLAEKIRNPAEQFRDFDDYLFAPPERAELLRAKNVVRSAPVPQPT